MDCVLETIVRGEAIVDQGAGVVQADDLLQGVGTAAAVDEVRTRAKISDRIGLVTMQLTMS